jgi:hypothetical protein
MDLFDFDTVLLPVNPAEPSYLSFLDTVIPRALEKGMGIVGMKVYWRGLARDLPGYRSMEPFFHFALSQPVCTCVIGCDTIAHLEENVRFATDFRQISPDAANAMIRQVRPYARQLMYYKPRV